MRKQIKKTKKDVVVDIKENQEIVESPVISAPVVSEKEELLRLYQTLKDKGINSIGDLEVKISRL